LLQCLFPVLQLFVPMLHVFAELAFENLILVLHPAEEIEASVPAYPGSLAAHRSFPKIANAFQSFSRACSLDSPSLFSWATPTTQSSMGGLFFGVTGGSGFCSLAKQGPISYSTSSESGQRET